MKQNEITNWHGIEPMAMACEYSDFKHLMELKVLLLTILEI